MPRTSLQLTPIHDNEIDTKCARTLDRWPLRVLNSPLPAEGGVLLAGRSRAGERHARVLHDGQAQRTGAVRRAAGLLRGHRAAALLLL